MRRRTRQGPEDIVETMGIKKKDKNRDSNNSRDDMWAKLPELILVQVFSHLDREDRANVGQVCKHWANCLASPRLWRRCTVKLDQDFGNNCSLANELLVKYSEYMRSLELAWSQPYRNHRTMRDKQDRELLPRQARSVPAEVGADFLGSIRGKDVQLRELVLTDWINSSKWSNCSKLLYALANLLACQQNLEKLSLLNANLTLADVLRLLAIVGRVCGSRLATLDLRGAFKDWQAPHNSARYFKLLNRLQVLAHLSLDYPALSDDTLNALANGASKTLRTLQIVVRASDSRQHRVDDAAWRNVRQACPLLAVTYTTLNLAHHEDLCYLLLPSIPLVKFQMYDCLVWDQSRTRNFRGTVGLLVTHYTNTLTDVLLQLKYNKEMMDDLIVSMVTRCRRLQNFKYEGIMRNVETIRDICQLQADCKTFYQTILVNVNPKNVNGHNRSLLHNIGHQFNEKMMERGIDFRIENPI